VYSHTLHICSGQASELCRAEQQSNDTQQRERIGTHPCAHSHAHTNIQFTLRTNNPSDEEEEDEREEEKLEEEVIISPRRAQMREIFPERPLGDLMTALDLAGTPMCKTKKKKNSPN